MMNIQHILSPGRICIPCLCVFLRGLGLHILGVCREVVLCLGRVVVCQCHSGIHSRISVC